MIKKMRYKGFPMDAVNAARRYPKEFEAFIRAGGTLPMVPFKGAADVLDPEIKRAIKLAQDQTARDRDMPSGFSRDQLPGQGWERDRDSYQHDNNMARSMASDPPVSEPQARAMYAAAEGNSTLGIPKKVGEEFVGKGDEDPIMRHFGTPNNPPMYADNQHRQFTDDLSDGGAPNDFGTGRDCCGRARDALADPQSDLFNTRTATMDDDGELESGVSGEPSRIAALRAILMACNIPEPQIDACLNRILWNEMSADVYPGGPEPFKGMPQRGTAMMAGDSALDDFNKQYPRAFATEPTYINRGQFDNTRMNARGPQRANSASDNWRWTLPQPSPRCWRRSPTIRRTVCIYSTATSLATWRMC
jgi:hypothetical protein